MAMKKGIIKINVILMRKMKKRVKSSPEGIYVNLFQLLREKDLLGISSWSNINLSRALVNELIVRKQTEKRKTTISKI